jgi:hypothetical protein
MVQFRRFFDGRAFVIGVAIAVVGAMILRALSQMPFWVCFVMVLAAMMLNSWLAEWEDNQPGGFNNPNTDERDTKDR